MITVVQVNPCTMFLNAKATIYAISAEKQDRESFKLAAAMTKFNLKQDSVMTCLRREKRTRGDAEREEGMYGDESTSLKP